MSSYQPPGPRLSWTQLLAPFFVGVGLPFAEVLSAQDIIQAFADEAVTFGALAKAVFTPAAPMRVRPSARGPAPSQRCASVAQQAVSWDDSLGNSEYPLRSASITCQCARLAPYIIWRRYRLHRTGTHRVAVLSTAPNRTNPEKLVKTSKNEKAAAYNKLPRS
jgi:hypothetical protein